MCALKMTLQHPLPKNRFGTKESEESSTAWKLYFKSALDLTADFLRCHILSLYPHIKYTDLFFT